MPYKIVTKWEDGTFCSFITHHKRCRVEYKPGKWARPREGMGPLCVFDSLDRAVWFLSAFRKISYAIFECEIEPSDRDVLYDGFVHKRSTPQGTILAEAVMITERIS